MSSVKITTVGELAAFIADKPLDMPVALSIDGLPEHQSGISPDFLWHVATTFEVDVRPLRREFPKRYSRHLDGLIGGDTKISIPNYTYPPVAGLIIARKRDVL